jgi:Predicted transcriptional regulators
MFNNSNEKEDQKSLAGCVRDHSDDIDNAKSSMPDDRTVYDLSDLFKVLSDSTRLKILWSMENGELCVCCISEVVNMSVSAVSHQLKTLKQANLIKSEKKGKNVYYSLNDDHVKDILEIALEHMCE